MKQRTINAIRKRYDIESVFSDADIADAFDGSLTEALIDLYLAASDLSQQIKIEIKRLLRFIL